MSRVDLEAAAKAAWIRYRDLGPMPRRQLRKREYIAGYIRGRLDQAEVDARIAEGRHDVGWEGNPIWTARYPDDGRRIAAAIRKGVQ